MTTTKWWTLGVVAVATFMLLLDITVVNTALPAIQRTSTRASPIFSGWSTPTP